MKEKKERLLYLDILRVLACFGVIIVHVSAMLVIEYPEPEGIVWKTINVFNGMGRFAVPVFIMLSGCLLLDNNRIIEASSFYKRQLRWMIEIFVGWLLFYAVFYSVCLPILTNEEASFAKFWGYIVSFKGSNCPHLWYMFMVIGMYLGIPVFKLFVKKENKNIVFGMIILSILTQYLPPLLNIISMYHGASSSVDTFVAKFYLSPLGGYVGILLAGWYFSTFEINKKERYIIYILGICSLIGSILATQFLIGDIPTIRACTYSHFTFCPVMEAIALFVFVKKVCGMKMGAPRFIAHTVDVSLGIYLVHVLLIELFYRVILHFEVGLMNPVIYLIIEFAFVCAGAYLVTYLLSLNSKTRKWIYMK